MLLARPQYATTMKKAIIAIQLLLICASLSARAVFHISGGFGTGQDYLRMSASEKRAYAMGAVNGMVVAPFFGAPEKSTKWLYGYFKGGTSDQMAAIITKYLNDNPQLWHQNLNYLTYNAIHDAYEKAHPQGR